MYKGEVQTIPFFVYNLTTGVGIAGLTGITCKIAKDGGTWTNATNTPVEQSSGTVPGWYKIELTAEETDANIIQLHFEQATATIYDVTLMTDPPIEAIAQAVLVEDCSSSAVTTDAYTLKHLIMASQCSETTVAGDTVTWSILDSDKETPIASRDVTLNSNGAIVSVK